MEFKDIVKTRFSAKAFKEEKLPKEKVDELIEMIRFSASSYNLQPWKIKIVTDQKTKEELLKASFGQVQVTTCSHLLVFCANTDVEDLIKRLGELMIKKGVPKEKVEFYLQIVNNSPKLHDETEKKHWATRQVYIALGNALNGAKALGFDGCPMEGFNPQEYSKILNLPTNLIPTVIFPIGYSATEFRPKIRFTREEIVF